MSNKIDGQKYKIALNLILQSKNVEPFDTTQPNIPKKIIGNALKKINKLTKDINSRREIEEEESQEDFIKFFLATTALHKLTEAKKMRIKEKLQILNELPLKCKTDKK